MIAAAFMQTRLMGAFIIAVALRQAWQMVEINIYYTYLFSRARREFG
jgi:hypothetical protein